MNPRESRISFIDIKTTGPQVGRHEIVEIGIVQARAPKLEESERFSLRVAPERIEDGDVDALNRMKFDPQEWREARGLRDAMLQLIARTSRSIWCLHRPEVHLRFIEHALEQFAMERSAYNMGMHILDTATLAWACAAPGVVRDYELHTIGDYLGIVRAEPGPGEAAEADADLTRLIYREMMAWSGRWLGGTPALNPSEGAPSAPQVNLGAPDGG